MEEEKVKAMLDWLVPKSVKDVQKFLGLANYYRKFLEGFAKIVRLFHFKAYTGSKNGKSRWIE